MMLGLVCLFIPGLPIFFSFYMLFNEKKIVPIIFWLALVYPAGALIYSIVEGKRVTAPYISKVNSLDSISCEYNNSSSNMNGKKSYGIECKVKDSNLILGSENDFLASDLFHQFANSLKNSSDLSFDIVLVQSDASTNCIRLNSDGTLSKFAAADEEGECEF